MFRTSPHLSCVQLVFLFFFFSYIDAGYIQRHLFPVSYPEIRPARPYVSSISSKYLHQKRPPSYLASFIHPKPTSFHILHYRKNESSPQISDSTNRTTEKNIESLEKELGDLRTVENVLKDAIVQVIKKNFGFLGERRVEQKEALNHDMDTKNPLQKKNKLEEWQPTQMEEEMENQQRSLRERETKEDENDELLEAKMSHKEAEDELQDFVQNIKDDVKDHVKQKLRKKMEKDLERQMEKIAGTVEDKEETLEKAAEAEDSLENQQVKNLLQGDEGIVEKEIHDLSSKSNKAQEKLQETQSLQGENIDQKNALNHSLEDHCFDHTITSKDLPTHDQTSFRQECQEKPSGVFSKQENIPPNIQLIEQSQYSAQLCHAVPEEVAETLADGSSTGELPSPPSSSSTTTASSKKKSVREHRRHHTPHSSQRSQARVHDEEDFSQQSTHPHSKKKKSQHENENEDEKTKVEKLSTFQLLYLAVLFPLGLASSAFLVVLFV